MRLERLSFLPVLGGDGVASPLVEGGAQRGAGPELVEFAFSLPPGHEGARPPRALLSLRAAGSMRYLLDEPNPRRSRFFASLGAGPVVATELHHTRRLRLVELGALAALPSEGELDLGELPGRDIGDGGPDGAAGRDGLIFFPAASGTGKGYRPVATVTVADCMPLWLWDAASGAWGLLHSGWKGTGILAEAVRGLLEARGGRASSLSLILGPAIGPCCYEVPRERAAYFARNFGEACVDYSGALPRLDIRAANLAMAENLGVGALLSVEACTSCEPRLGSFRREGAASFTRMVAACLPA